MKTSLIGRLNATSAKDLSKERFTFKFFPEVKNNLKETPMFFQIVLGMEFLGNRVALMNSELRRYAARHGSINLTLYLFSPNLICSVENVV